MLSRSGEVKKELRAPLCCTASFDSARDRSLGAGLLLSWNDCTLSSEQIVDFIIVGCL